MAAATNRVDIDLNADLGESFGRWQLGDDEAMLDLITSANVACGFHAGDPTTLVGTCRAAARRGVRIGAQVSYRDLAGFGRRFIDVSPADLRADVLYQLGALEAVAVSEGSRVSYLKPHGALYNAVVHHEQQADAVLDAVQAFSRPLPVLGLPGSVILTKAQQRGVATVAEYFIDRRYTPQGTLVDRRRPDAMITDVAEATERALAAARDGRGRSFCTHGDSPGAVQMAGAVRAGLEADGVTITPFS